MAISLDYIYQLCMEGESSHLDYKREQYVFVKAQDSEKEELLKDILAMANAFRSQVAFILIGVEQQQDGIGKVTGIPKVQFIDDAKLQQFINSKTNRPVEFHSYSVSVDDEKIIQVIEIPVQKERPYYSKKDFGSVSAGTVEIRAGSSTHHANPDEIARMGKEEIIQRNQREIEISLIVPRNPVEKLDFSALDIVLEGDPPVETDVEKRLYYIKYMCRPIYFNEKLAFVRDVFRTFRVDIALKNKSALSAEQLEVETFVLQSSYPCVSEKAYFPEHPNDPTPSVLKNIPSLQQRRLHPGQSDSKFESRYFEANRDGDFAFDVAVLGKDMQPIRKSFPIHVQLKKYPLHADQIEKLFDLFKNENACIQIMKIIGDNEK